MLIAGYIDHEVYVEIVQDIGLVIDALGVIIIVAGTIAAFTMYVGKIALRSEHHVTYQRSRYRLARSIIFGLELLIAGDIIRTVALTPTFENIGVLALIVLVRTFLAFTLEMEVEGRWPWQLGDPMTRARILDGEAAGQQAD